MCFIDYDEIESLLKGIEYIATVKSDNTRLDKFEATYKTKGDLRVGTFSIGKEGVEAVVKSGYIGSTSAFISLQQLAELRGLVSQAKQRLDSIK